MIWNDKEIVTARDLFDALVACQTREQADEFMATYRQQFPGTEADADANVGYVIGYGDDTTRERLYGLFKVAHPVYGGAV